MDVKAFLHDITASRSYKKQIAYTKLIPARRARYTYAAGISSHVTDALARIGIEKLYTHQAKALEVVQTGKNAVIVTGTASGKSLCYNLPVIDALRQDPAARALYLFPTKALTQDQMSGLARLIGNERQLTANVLPAIYDGDTPRHQRTSIRRSATVVLSNPDMLHAGILPYHPKWARLFEGLKFVVIDEIHTYRGIFGSHVANVLRRLKRIAAHYGARPRFIASSATIANPAALAETLTGERFELVDDDGSPCGEKIFVVWNPPVTNVHSFLRRSANVEAAEILAELIKRGSSTILFARARVVAELIHRYAAERLRRDRKTASLATRMAPYRGGYLPEDRRRIERELFSGRLRAVTSTNALELGIDVGSLDAAVIVGYPGSRASTWQQAGRAGRRGSQSLTIMVAYDEPTDQFIAHRPDYLFGAPVEEATIDPENPHILQGHILSAAAERPLAESEATFLGENAAVVAESLERQGKLKRIAGAWYPSSAEFAAHKLNLRLISSDTYEIVDVTGTRPAVIGNVDSISAPELVYPGAVYLHEGKSYLCERLDTANKVAEVHAAEMDYYTQPILSSSVRVTDTSEESQRHSCRVSLGDIEVTWATAAFKKIRFLTMEMIGQGELDLPAQTLPTRALWIMPAAHFIEELATLGYRPLDAMTGAKNLLMIALSMMAMSDLRDIWGLVSPYSTPRPSIFLYDRYPGGIGYAEKGFDRLDEMLRRAVDILRNCHCSKGCPSCVGLPNPRPPLHQDPEMYGGSYTPDRLATEVFLRQLMDT